jgi:transposase-like protein
MVVRRIHSEKFKIEIGKKLHDGHWVSASAASRELDIHDSLLAKWKAKYRALIGWTKDSERAQAINTTWPTELAVVPDKPVTYHVDPIVYEQRINELEHELHDAHRKIDVLQNLLMVVGGTLV